MSLARSRPVSAGAQRYADRVVAAAGIVDDAVAERLRGAFAACPRGPFVHSAFVGRAAEDIELPIGFDQSMERPSRLAQLLGLLNVSPGARVLEVGLGAGYAAALMSEIGAHVFSLEIVGLLAQRSRKVLDALGYQNVIVKTGSGVRGWREHAPYDSILISAPDVRVSDELLAQLAPHGKLVVSERAATGTKIRFWEMRRQGLVCYEIADAVESVDSVV